MFKTYSEARMLPPRIDLKTKPKKGKGLGKTAPIPKQLKPDAIIELEPSTIIKHSNNSLDNFLSDNNNSFFKSIKEHSSNEAISQKENVTLSFNSNDWLFTQVTAISSVIIDKDGNVDADTAKYVNGNGNCWSNEDLKKYYRTFVGAHNYKNHEQDARKSYGVVIDARLRKLNVTKDKFVYYVDLLIATNRVVHPDWVQKIEQGAVRYVSMGCESTAVRCTRCGKIVTNENEYCSHLLLEKNYFYFKNNGDKFIIAEQVIDSPNHDGESFINFIEISYLTENPAFKGAAKSHTLKLPKGVDMKVTIPAKYFEKEAFQVWKKYIKVIK